MLVVMLSMNTCQQRWGGVEIFIPTLLNMLNWTELLWIGWVVDMFTLCTSTELRTDWDEASDPQSTTLNWKLGKYLLIKVNNWHFVTWPLLTQHNVSKHFPKSNKTFMGHTNQQRQGVQSTKPRLVPQPDTTPVAEANKIKPTHAIIITAVYKLTHTIYSGQSDRLPCHTHTGYQYYGAYTRTVTMHSRSNSGLHCPTESRTNKSSKQHPLSRSKKSLHSSSVWHH
jgi:hypothetical protein